jgi:hypothetical protein
MDTKTCTVCRIEKPTTDFYSDKKMKSGLRADCKECVRAKERERQKDPSRHKRHIETSKAYSLARRLDMQVYVLTILNQRGCIDCGETDPIVLDFDHVRDTKTSGISRMMRHYCTWEELEKEIAKCDVRCANCHRRKTAKERHYYSMIDLTKLS